jgi:hypothetical protein
MKRHIVSLLAVILFSSAVFAQKGIDPQTQKIREEGVKTVGTQRSNEPSNKSFDFGKGKTKVRAQLANPYKLKFSTRHFN